MAQDDAYLIMKDSHSVFALYENLLSTNKNVC